MTKNVGRRYSILTHAMNESLKSKSTQCLKHVWPLCLVKRLLGIKWQDSRLGVPSMIRIHDVKELSYVTERKSTWDNQLLIHFKRWNTHLRQRVFRSLTKSWPGCQPSMQQAPIGIWEGHRWGSLWDRDLVVDNSEVPFYTSPQSNTTQLSFPRVIYTLWWGIYKTFPCLITSQRKYMYSSQNLSKLPHQAHEALFCNTAIVWQDGIFMSEWSSEGNNGYLLTLLSCQLFSWNLMCSLDISACSSDEKWNDGYIAQPAFPQCLRWKFNWWLQQNTLFPAVVSTLKWTIKGLISSFFR